MRPFIITVAVLLVAFLPLRTEVYIHTETATVSYRDSGWVNGQFVGIKLANAVRLRPHTLPEAFTAYAIYSPLAYLVDWPIRVTIIPEDLPVLRQYYPVYKTFFNSNPNIDEACNNLGTGSNHHCRCACLHPALR